MLDFLATQGPLLALGQCLQWLPMPFGILAVAKTLIAAASVSMAATLFYILRRRPDLGLSRIIGPFAAFILAAGLTQLLGFWTSSESVVLVHALATIGTAAAGIYTAVAFWPLLPKMARLASPRALEAANLKLRREIVERKEAQEQLQRLREELERRVDDRTRELALANSALRREIAEREKAESALYREAERLRSVVDHVVDGIISVNDRFVIESWNPAAERIFGYASREVVGESLAVLLSDHVAEAGVVGDGVSSGLSALAGLSEAGGQWRELTGLRKDGSTFPLELAVSGFHLGQHLYYTGIIRDVTERRKTEEALLDAKEAADDANQAKSRFLANMSHEIRTPLGAILGFSELLLNPHQPLGDKAECIAAIRRNGELLSNIINDILDLSKVEAGKLQVERQEVELSEVITDISSLLGLQAREKGITLSVRYEGVVPSEIRTDALRLRQILVNIVGNAIKFTSRGEVEVTIRLAPQAQGRALLAFAVKDTGCGIPAIVAARLFNPFAQGDSSRTRNLGGAGLGLVLARRLAQLLGGEVELSQSTPGSGSTFTITVDPGELTPVRERPALAPDGPGRVVELAGGLRRLDGVKILLVDDSPDNQLLITKFLTMAGAEVEVANNGREGVEKTNRGEYDIVVMDIQMPVMDGYEAVQHLRLRGYKRPIIALTAHALKEEQQRCLQSGFDSHLSKPVNRQFLIEKLSHFAQRA